MFVNSSGIIKNFIIVVFIAVKFRLSRVNQLMNENEQKHKPTISAKLFFLLLFQVLSVNAV